MCKFPWQAHSKQDGNGATASALAMEHTEAMQYVQAQLMQGGWCAERCSFAAVRSTAATGRY